jgi:hypothetical protein
MYRYVVELWGPSIGILGVDDQEDLLVIVESDQVEPPAPVRELDCGNDLNDASRVECLESPSATVPHLPELLSTDLAFRLV